ncbi:MAG: FAD-dependent hydroxylase [Elainellaceae cyanobacterium]
MLDLSSNSTASPRPNSKRHNSGCTGPLHTNVAIVGGGIVGMTLAAALKSSGLQVTIIDASPREATLTRERAYAITLLSGTLFDDLGLWSSILPDITTFNTIRLADAQCPAVVNLRPSDLGTAALGYVGEHRILARELQRCLDTASNIRWLCPARVDSVTYGNTSALLRVSQGGETYPIQADVVVAADGSRSQLRQQAQITTMGWKYWQSCVTAVIRPEHSHGNIAREHFWPSGPFATLPLPGNRCQIVLTAPHAEAENLLAMSDQDFLALLSDRYGGALGQLELLGQRRLFPVQLMHSSRYVKSRLVLVGDAAHCCHPVGGQGLNLGIRDAAALAQTLRSAHKQGRDIGALPTLKRYERWRQIENLAILGFTDVLDRSFSNRWPPVVMVRRLGLRVMARVRPVRWLALKIMTGLMGRSPQLPSSLTQDDRSAVQHLEAKANPSSQ